MRQLHDERRRETPPPAPVSIAATAHRQVAASKDAIKRSIELLKRSAKPPKGPYWG
jgi:hypothetical protein